MATATKKTKVTKATKGKPAKGKTTAKAKAVKVTAAKAKDTKPRRGRDELAKLQERVAKMREGNLSWDQIGAELGIAANLAWMLGHGALVRPKDRIKGTDEQMAAKVVEARHDLHQSWGVIALRIDPLAITVAKAKALYEEATGESSQQGNRVVQERIASRPVEDKPKKKAAKAKVASGKSKSAVNKDKRKATIRERKTSKGSANPS